MSARTTAIVGLTVALLSVGRAVPAAADKAVDEAFETLTSYDWGDDRDALKPIDNAVVAVHGDAKATAALADRLTKVLETDAPRAAKDYACRKLSMIGSAECVPTVAKLLDDKELSHMGRYVLERIPAPEAVAAIRDALPKVDGELKIGMISSLGVRRDEKATGALKDLLTDENEQVAAAAAAALGEIGTPEAAKALKDFQGKAPKELKLCVASARLRCAEQLLEDGKKADAVAIYKDLSKSGIKHVKLAAARGMLAAQGKK